MAQDGDASDTDTDMDAARRRGWDEAIGYAAAAVAIVIWAGWIVVTRHAVGADYGVDLTPLDIVFLRFGAPALMFSPFWLRYAPKPTGVSWMVMAGLLAWGAPFGYFASAGLQNASAAEMAALVPGMMPLWAALFAWLAVGERFSAVRRLGLALIAAAGAAILLPAGLGAIAGENEGRLLFGAPWLIAASMSWAIFSVAFKGSGLGPVAAAGLVGAYSVAIGLVLSFALETRLFDLPGDALIWQIVTQGVLTGAVSIAAYALAIDKLGAARAASLSALVPVMAALFGVLALGEALSPLETAAIVSASLGVALVNGVRPPRRA